MEKSFIKFITIVIGLAIVLSSCTKTIVDKQVYVDSYIHSIFNKAGIPVYNVMHTAYSFTKISSVSVTGASSAAIQLTNVGDNGFSFYTPIEKDTASYKLAVPTPDTYTYKATLEIGDVVSAVNSTVAKSLMPVTQLSAVKNPTDIVLSWKPVANVEAYKVRIYSEDTTSKLSVLIYESNFLVPKDATSDLSIPFSLTSLSQYLDSNLTFEVSAFIFETNSDYFQATSTTAIKKYFGV